MFSNEKWFGVTDTGFYPETIEQSLRFDGSTSKLEKTPSSDGDRKKWTSSWWIKRSKLGALQYMWSGASYSGNDGIAALYFNSDDKIYMYFDTSGSNPYGAINSRLYRDTTNWYHIVWAVDAVNTEAKVWVNGVEETSSIQPPNYSYGMNKASTKMAFGVASWGGSPNYNGYCAEFVHLDGQYLDETYFGEFKNGVWIPKNIKDQNFTFGTNGFYLPFSDSSNIGYDYQTSDRSGTTNDYTATGLASTDVSNDSPTNNFCTMNPLQKGAYVSLSEGNLKVAGNNATNSAVALGTFAQTSGKWYFEVRQGTVSSEFIGVMVKQVSFENSLIDGSNVAQTQGKGVVIRYNGNVRGISGELQSVSAFSYTAGDIIGIAFDMDNGAVYFAKNNTWLNSGDPTSGSSKTGSFLNFTVDDTRIATPALDSYTGGFVTGNFGQDSSFAGTETAQGNADENGQGDFYYTPPSGYLALCSSNLPDTTLSPNQSEQADDYFNTVLYTGNGSTNAITGVGFQPDWVWSKRRNASGSHNFWDSSRGTTKLIFPDAGSVTEKTVSGLTSFDSDGFTMGSEVTYSSNISGSTYVAWNWKINGGTTSSNSEGSLTCTTQASTEAGISIVTWAGDGNTSVTLGHGLEKKPELIIYMGLDNSFEHPTWFKTFGTSTGSFISTSNQPGAFARVMSEPTDTVIPNAEKNYTNVSGEDNIAYVFHSIEGFSKIDSYTGNNSTDGTFVYTGFRPAWLMLKRSSGTGGWQLLDNTRNTFNAVDIYLTADGSHDEVDGSGLSPAINVDFLSNGFKLRTTEAVYNSSGGTFIYMAFAEQPFKFSNAR